MEVIEMRPLRKCRICGKEVLTLSDLNDFTPNKPSKLGYQNICKSCHREMEKEYKRRTKEFTAKFKNKNKDGKLQCYFCQQEIIKIGGHCGECLAIHSLDGNHENWDDDNKVPVHNKCHMIYHGTGEKSARWKGEKATKDAKRKRIGMVKWH